MKFLHFFIFVTVTLLSLPSSFGQSYFLDGIAITPGSTTNVCPNTSYVFTVTGGTARAHYAVGSGTATNVEFRRSNSTLNTGGPYCSLGGATPDTEMRITFIASGTYAIAVSDEDVTAGCDAIAPTANFTFVVQNVYDQTAQAAKVICSGAASETITASNGGNFSPGTISYNWYKDANVSPITGANTGSYNVPIGDFAIAGETHTYRLEVTYGALGCFDEETYTVTRQETPSLTSIVFDPVSTTAGAINPNFTNTTAETEICSYGTQDMAITCTNCDGVADSYTWQWRNVSGGFTGITGGTAATTGVGPYISTMELDGGTTPLLPGLYDLRVMVSNTHGCSITSSVLTDALTINDRPGVEIMHDNALGNWSSPTTANGVTICTGKLLSLAPKNCDATNYSTNGAPNQSSATQPNLYQPGNTQNIVYTSPCDPTLSNYFADLKWTADAAVNYSGDGTLNTVPNPDEYDINSPNGTTTSNVVTITKATSGTVTYTLEVTGDNGCTNTDDITVIMDDPRISFNAPYDGTQTETHTTGQSITGCVNSTIQIEALCDLCEPGFTDVDWTHSASANGLPTSPTNNTNPVTTTTLSDAAANTLTVTVTDAKGCFGTATLIVDDAPTPTVSASMPSPLCSGGDLEMTDANFSSTYDYAIYDSDPSVGSPTPLFTCTGSGVNSVVGNDNCTGTIPALTVFATCLPMAFDMPLSYENPQFTGNSGSHASCAPFGSGNGNNYDDAWYSFVATGTSTTIDVTSNRNALVAVFDACGGTELASGCDYSAGTPATPGNLSVTVTTAVGVTYYVQLHRWEGVTAPDTWEGTICVHGAGGLAGTCGVGNTITAPGVNPVDGTTYWLEATLNGCSGDDDEPANVTETPDINYYYPSNPYTYYSDVYPVCDAYNRYFYATTQLPNLSYTWQTIIGTCTGGGCVAGTTGSVYSYYTNGSNYSRETYRIDAGAPTQENSILRVSADNGGCVGTFDYVFDVEVCSDPELRISTRVASGPTTNNIIRQNYFPTSSSYSQCQYICEGDKVRYDINYGNSDAIYIWNTGEITQDIEVVATSSTPDTIYRSCSIYIVDNSFSPSDTNFVAELNHTIVISRGDFVWYPLGDGDDTDTGVAVDSAICLNDIAYNQAYCPGCKGTLTYTWDSGTPNSTLNPNAVQVYGRGPITTTTTAPGTPDFSVELVLTHGESCVETAYREFDVNELPSVGLLHYDGTAFVPLTAASTILPLCDGATEQLRVNCPSCTNFAWNTTATTPTINVISQGGYYAEASDANGCSRLSGVALFVDAHEGLNSAVAANPTQICSGNDAILEVAPCNGCSYQWFDISSGNAIPAGRLYTTSDSGDYFAHVINAEGCIYPTAQVSISETTVTIPTITATTDSICPSQSTTLSTSSGSGFMYQWYWNGGTGATMNPVSGATNPTYTTPDTGRYRVAVTYPNGCIEESALFEINSAAFTPSIAASGSVICRGDSVDVITDLHAGWQYQWYRDGILIPGATGSIYSASMAGVYYAEVTNYNLCVEQTAQIPLSFTSLPIPNATTNTPTVCPGEYGELSVSLCSGCSYEWFNDVGISISTKSTLGYNYDSVAVTDCYYAEVSINGCTENSDTVCITVNSVFTPAITSSSSVVCNGRDATLTTPSCVGCSYTWLVNGSPVLGALNDTFHIVDNVIDTGDYQIAIDYPNGCADTSAILTISDGSYTLDLRIQGGPPVDSVICNGVGEVLEAITSDTLTGTYFFTLFLDNTAVTTPTNYSNVTSNVFPADNAGVYTVESTDPLGCIALSNILPIREVTVTPVLTARATSDPSSVTASAICTDSGTVFLEVGNCVGCDYVWKHGSNTILSTDTFFMEDFNGPNAWTGSFTQGSAGTHGTANDSLTPNGTNFLVINEDATPVACTYCDVAGPSFTLSPTNVDLIEKAILHFDVYKTTGVRVHVKISVGGGSWVPIYTIPTRNNGWERQTLDITNYIDSGAIQIQFQYDKFGTSFLFGQLRRAVAIDNILVTREYRTTYITDQGTAGTGGYVVEATNDGCSRVSNLVTIADLTVISNPLNSNANTTDTSICNGQSVTLEHAASAGNPSLNCSGCSFRWLRNESPINGASSYQYVTSTEGVYRLEITTTDGCVDTSDLTNIREVIPPDSLRLDLDSVVALVGTGTPLASSGTAINLDNWVFPDSAQNQNLTGGNTSYFTSAPYNGALPPNAGLFGTDSLMFGPADSLSGYHLITYHYNTQGCSFAVDDVLEVLPPASIVVTNANPSSVPYEACVGDVLTITTTYLDFPIDSVYVFDVDDNYVYLDTFISSIVVDTLYFGPDTVYNSTIVFTVPGFAYASYLMLKDSAPSTFTDFTPFVLIHNTDLSYTGLPSTLCSNGTPITLFGNPSGGSFYVKEANFPYNTVAGATVGDTLYPANLNTASYVNGNQFVDIFYSYTETYTNGNLCPSNDTTSIRREVKDVRLTNVVFNDVAVSQDQELLTNLVFRTYPYEARPNKQPLYTSSFSGAFTHPAGNPVNYLPKNAGVGSHALTYSIQSGICVNSVTSNIDVVPAPTPIAIPDTICRNFAPLTFGRDANYPYIISPTTINVNTVFNDTFNAIQIFGEGVQPVLPFNVANESWTYDPSIVVGNHDTLIIEYWFRRSEDTTYTGPQGQFDSLNYVIGRVYQPIYIEDLKPVSIDPIVQSFYCQKNTLHLLSGTPSFDSTTFSGGIFTLLGGNFDYATGDTLFNNVINPYDVNWQENAVTDYTLIYTLDGAVCKNSDSMTVTISKGLNPSFTTQSGSDEFCDTDPDELILTNVVFPDTAIWKIGGIPQSDTIFPPLPLDFGIHIVELQMIDTFGCSETAVDTFTIHPLPVITMNPSLDQQYCANDSVVDLVALPVPGCPSFASTGHFLIKEDFVGGIPALWPTVRITGKAWSTDGTLPQGGSDFAAFVDTSNVDTDTWLITDSLDLVNGHVYRLTYMVRAGDLDPTCSGLCDAQLRVGLGNQQLPSSLGTTLDYQQFISNDQTYVRLTSQYTHTYPSGKYFIGFNVFTPAFGRSLRVDNVRLRDMTIGSCSQEGIGYMEGPGMHNVVDSLYQFNPLAALGNIEVKYIYTDINGCQDSLVEAITVDTVPLVSFTDMDPQYCLYSPTVMLTGTPTLGTFASTLFPGPGPYSAADSNLINIPFNAPLVGAHSPVYYRMNNDGQDVVSYTFTDDNGCSDTQYDTVVIVPLLDSVEISDAFDPIGIGICEDAAPIPLTVNLISGSMPAVGFFYGAGVRNGNLGANGAMLHPDSAVLDMGHTGEVLLTYIYQTSTGCWDTTRFMTEVHALPRLSYMNLPDSMCLNRDSFQLVAINNVITGVMGQINYFDTLGQQTGTYVSTDTSGNTVPGFIVLFDTLMPQAATGYSQVNVQYTYTTDTSLGACTATIYDSVRIDTVPNVYFQNLDDYYCENAGQSIMLAFPPYSVGSGYLIIDSTGVDTATSPHIDSSFYIIDPLTMVGGMAPNTTDVQYHTYYIYTDTRGCTNEVFDSFEIRAIERINFTLPPVYQDTFCRELDSFDLRNNIQPLNGQGIGTFTDNLALSSILSGSYLNLNSAAGPRQITYTWVDTQSTCINKDSFDVWLFNGPDLDYTAYGGCTGLDILFDGTASNLQLGIDSITQIWWVFDTLLPSPNVYSPLDTSPITIPDITTQYNTGPGTYFATLYVENQSTCVATVTKPIIISNTVTPYPIPYEEDFNGAAATIDWYNDQPIGTTSNPIWVVDGPPNITNATIALTDPAMTVLGDTLYKKDQKGWIYSPCFDFTQSERPMFKMDIWRDMLEDIDGVIMEYYDNTTNTWERLGDVNIGINWYQSDFVLSRPGNQTNVTYPRAWTGQSNTWEDARIRLDQFKGQGHIRFRMAFASSPQTVLSGHEGFAFDNVWVGERTRNVLVEHFDNTGYVNLGSQGYQVVDQSVYDKIFNSSYGLDVFMIQYQTQYNNPNDYIYVTNTPDPQARTLFYGINENNQIMIDGRSVGTGVSEDLSTYDMDYDMLQFPDFDIQLSGINVLPGNIATVTSTVTALNNMPLADYAVHTVFIQDSLNVDPNGNGFEMLSVMRKMIPDATGTTYNQAWTGGFSPTVEVTTASWDYTPQLATAAQSSFVPTRLEAVVFIQDMNTKEVFQVATTADLSAHTGTGKIEDEAAYEITKLNVYPNPSADIFNVEFEDDLEGDYEWALVDVAGRILQNGTATSGTRKFTINAEQLASGAYFFVIKGENITTQRKLIVARP